MGADAATALDDPVRAIVASAGLDAAVFNPLAPADQRFKALVFDATGADLVELHRFFHPTVRRVLPSGRVIVLGDGRRALEGFTRSLGKEIGRGATVNLVHVEPVRASTRRCGSCSRRARRTCPARSSASVRARMRRWPAGAPWSPARARGIGAAIADVLEREGASVVRVDLPDDSTSPPPDAPARLGRAVRGRARRARPQRRHHARPHAGQDARGALAEADGRQPRRARADHGGAAAGACASAGGSSACRR